MRRHILYVNTPSQLGGAEISLLELMKNLEKERFTPYLLTSGFGVLYEKAVKEGVQTLTQGFPLFSRRRPWQYSLSIYKLVTTIREKKIDLVHTNCEHSLRYVMLACRLARIPYISHVRDFVRSWFVSDNLVALQTAKKVIANSNAMAERCIEEGIAPNRVMVIYNPINLSLFQNVTTTKSRIRHELPIPEESIVVGIVSQIHPLKGHAEFIEAAFQVANRLPSVEFVIVGAPLADESAVRLAEELQVRVKASAFSGRFHFLGYRDDIPNVMRAIDILVVPSWSESFGRVAVEGMASGCAVVGTKVGGLTEIITDGVNGLLIPPRDIPSLVIALSSLVTDEKARNGFVANARNTIGRFGIYNHVHQVQNLYEIVLNDQA